MQVSAIQNYHIQQIGLNSGTKTAKLNQTQAMNQTSFKSGKGALIGGIGGALVGIGVLICTGGLAAVGAGLAALTAGGYGLAGSVVGDAATGGGTGSSNDQSHLHVH